jgi:site-specific DNA recombinase
MWRRCSSICVSPSCRSAGGEISEFHVGLKSTMNALFLKDLAAETNRGLRGRVEKGKVRGGLRGGEAYR